MSIHVNTNYLLTLLHLTSLCISGHSLKIAASSSRPALWANNLGNEAGKSKCTYPGISNKLWPFQGIPWSIVSSGSEMWFQPGSHMVPPVASANCFCPSMAEAQWRRCHDSGAIRRISRVCLVMQFEQALTLVTLPIHQIYKQLHWWEQVG